jgi:hypothetical protein
VPGRRDRPHVVRQCVAAGLTSGGGSYLPVCDGSSHTFTVRAVAFQGVYQAGIAQALTFAVVELGGVGFYGVDDGSIQIVT